MQQDTAIMIFAALAVLLLIWALITDLSSALWALLVLAAIALAAWGIWSVMGLL